MPDLSLEVKTKLAALRALPPGERLPAEMTAVYWPAPDGLKVYAIAPYDTRPGYEGLAPRLASELGYEDPLIVSLIPERNRPFADLPRSASIAEDGEDFTFSDIDGEFSELVAVHGEGVPLEVFYYSGGVDLLLSLWRGMTKSPKEMARDRVKISATTGFRSPQLLMPRRPHSTSCPFIFGALLDSQEEIDFHKGCPYNAHLGGSIGVPGFTDCPRAKVSDCSARLVTTRFWPGFDVRPDPVRNNQTRGPNLLASASGNASNLSDPVRVVIGLRHVKNLPLLAYRNETNTNHPDQGFGAGVFEVSEGPVQSLTGFYMNGVFVGLQHQNLRLGELGQPPTFFSPGVNSFSGTAHAFGRIQGNFNNNEAASLTASIWCFGLRNLRVYSDPDTYAEAYSTNRMDALLEMLTNPRWGYGNDHSRYWLDSVVETREWCDEAVSMRDPSGNVFAGTRSTFNAELTGRTTQQQISDVCVAGRIGLPFEFQGREMFVPLREETLDEAVPAFTDEGGDRNIVYDGERSSLMWSYASDSELVNQWTVNFDDYGNGGVETQLIFGDQRQQLRAGRAYGDRSVRTVGKSQSGFGITTFPEAARLGLTLLYLGPLDSGGIANNLRVKFTTWYSEAAGVRMYKPVRVLNAKMQQRALLRFESLGLPWFAGEAYEYFRVTKMERKGDLKVEITAQLYPADFYAWAEDPAEPPPLVTGPSLPNPGGRPDEQPEEIPFADLTHSGDRFRGRFADGQI